MKQKSDKNPGIPPWLILCLASVFFKTGAARPDYRILADGFLSPCAGSAVILSSSALMTRVEEKCLRPKSGSESSVPAKALGVGVRSLKTVFLDFPLVQMSWLVQHEFFGHGYRAREFGVADIGYHFDLPLPYGRGNASTRLSPDFIGMTPHEKSALFFSGSQAASLISNSLALKWTGSGFMDYRDAMLYLISFFDLTQYILGTDLRQAKEGSDITNYIQATYPGAPAEERLKKLKAGVRLNFLSPFPYLALFTFFKTHTWGGNPGNTLPMIPVSGFKVLPSFRFGLSPFGGEVFFENFIRTPNNLIYAYFRAGESSPRENWGAGAVVSGLWGTPLLSVDGRFHFWKQPALVLHDSGKGAGGAVYGGAVSWLATVSPFRNKHIGFLCELGYKSRGFLMNENLANGVILRAGLSCSGAPLW